jgi:membrane fusion protein (multidrug efflux system)
MLRKLMTLLMACLIIAAIAQLGCSNGDAQGKNGHATAADDTTKKDQDQPKKEDDFIPVETTGVKTGTISSFILLSSNLETEKMADVYSRVQGLVEEHYMEEGEFVKKDQVLMKLEADEYALAEAKANVEYEQQKNLFERSKAMFEKQLLSKEEFDQARFQFEAREIQWKQAQLNLDYTSITSPISGVIGERLRRQGDRIQPSDKLFTVINTEEMIAVVHIPEKEIGKIAKGQQAFLTSDNLSKMQFSGWIKRVSPVVDPQSGTFKVTVGIRNEENKLRPGMFVNVHIIIDTHKDAVLVPKTAIVYENEAMHVFVVRDSLAHKITLDAGFQDYEKIEVRSGIAENEPVIVVGQAGLKDQTKVKVVSQR